MKNIIILVTFMFVTFNFLSVRAQSQQLASVTERFSQFSYTEDDSLLFDGSYQNGFKINIKEDCLIKVISYIGNAQGPVYTQEIIPGCTTIDTIAKREFKQVKPGDNLLDGEFIRTGSNSSLTLEFKDGKRIKLGSNTEIKVGRNYCKDENGIQVEMLSGTVYIDGAQGDKNITMKTYDDNARVIITGTAFSFEKKISGENTSSIVRVYEGTVTFERNKNSEGNVNNINNQGKEMDKLAEDYKNGKLTDIEYSAKMQQMLTSVNNSISDSPVNVSAGFESIISGLEKPTEPVSFDVNDNRWWEN